MSKVKTMTDLIWENIDRKLYRKKLAEWREAGASEYSNLNRDKMYREMRKMWSDKNIRESIMLEVESQPAFDDPDLLSDPAVLLAERYLGEWIYKTYMEKACIDADAILNTLSIEANINPEDIEKVRKRITERFLFEFEYGLWEAENEENYNHPYKIAEMVVERASLAKRLEEVENEIRRIRSLLELD